MFIKELRQGGGETKRWKTYKVETIFEEAKAVGGQGPSLHAHTSRHVLEPNSIQATWWGGGRGGTRQKKNPKGAWVLKDLSPK
jgi:hypothetical protein